MFLAMNPEGSDEENDDDEDGEGQYAYSRAESSSSSESGSETDGSNSDSERGSSRLRDEDRPRRRTARAEYRVTSQGESPDTLICPAPFHTRLRPRARRESAPSSTDSPLACHRIYKRELSSRRFPLYISLQNISFALGSRYPDSSLLYRRVDAEQKRRGLHWHGDSFFSRAASKADTSLTAALPSAAGDVLAAPALGPHETGRRPGALDRGVRSRRRVDKLLRARASPLRPHTRVLHTPDIFIHEKRTSCPGTTRSTAATKAPASPWDRTTRPQTTTTRPGPPPTPRASPSRPEPRSLPGPSTPRTNPRAHTAPFRGTPTPRRPPAPPSPPRSSPTQPAAPAASRATTTSSPPRTPRSTSSSPRPRRGSCPSARTSPSTPRTCPRGRRSPSCCGGSGATTPSRRGIGAMRSCRGAGGSGTRG